MFVINSLLYLSVNNKVFKKYKSFFMSRANNLFKLFLFVVIFFMFPNRSIADSAPSMHLNTYTSKDAVLKMQKIKVIQSASASFFEVMNYTAGYCGFQQPGSTIAGNTIIASLWDPNTEAGIYSKVEYVHPTINSSRFGGEGDGYKTLGPYSWVLNQWYNIVVRSWKSNNKLFIATFAHDLSNSK